MSKPQRNIQLEYKYNEKYYEFWMEGELKERAVELSTLMQKVRKYKIGFEYGIDKFLED
jgi:hypothetical protein